MGQVVDGFETIKRETGATVLVIHHTRKNDLTERGSSALRGAADVMISCDGDLDGGALSAELKCEKMKDDEPFKEVGVRFEKVDLGDGKSSLVVAGPADLAKATSAHQDKIINILRTQFAEKGAAHNELKKAFVDSGAGSESTFNRAFKALKGSGRVQVREKRYFAASAEEIEKVERDATELKQTFADMRAGKAASARQ